MVDLKAIYWAAGFMDGEGSFGFHSKKPRLSCGQSKERWTLDKLADLFGGSVYGPYTTHGNYPYWNWQISGSRAVGVALTMFTILSPRRRGQIQILIEKAKQRVADVAADKLNGKCFSCGVALGARGRSFVNTSADSQRKPRCPNCKAELQRVAINARCRERKADALASAQGAAV